MMNDLYRVGFVTNELSDKKAVYFYSVEETEKLLPAINKNLIKLEYKNFDKIIIEYLGKIDVECVGE